MSTPLVFLDTETTGLDPRTHEIWEIGAIVREDGAMDYEYHWQIRPRIDDADPKALEIGRFHQRFAVPEFAAAARLGAAGPWYFYKSIYEVFSEIAGVLQGAHLVGAVPSFDDAFLKEAFRIHGLDVGWHYHLIDVEALAIGYLHGRKYSETEDAEWSNAVLDVGLPWKSEEMSRAVGIDPEQFDRHTALGDARWAKAIYDAVTGGGDVRG